LKIYLYLVHIDPNPQGFEKKVINEKTVQLS